MYFLACLYSVLCYDAKTRKYSYYIKQTPTVALLLLKGAHLGSYMDLFTTNIQIRVLIDMKRLSESN